MKQHGPAAQCRRRNDTGFSSGVTINQIRQHLLENVQGLCKHNISKSTVRRLFEAPNIDAHYLFARNKFRREFVSMFPRSASILSTDDMSKIKFGLPAVSRYHQVRKMFMKDENMNLPDYDFPVPRYL